MCKLFDGSAADQQVLEFLQFASRVMVTDRVRVGVRVRVSTYCGSYFYILNTRKVYFTMGLFFYSNRLVLPG